MARPKASPFRAIPGPELVVKLRAPAKEAPIEEEIAAILDEEVLDEGGKCTKATKKASSTS